MSKCIMFATAMVVALMAGCDKDEPKQPQPQAKSPNPAAAAATPQSGTEANQNVAQAQHLVRSALSQTGDQVKATTTTVVTQVSKKASATADQLKTAATQAVDQVKEKGTTFVNSATDQLQQKFTSATSASEQPDVASYVNDQLLKATQFMKDSKTDEAEKCVVEAEKHRTEVSSSLQGRIRTVRSTLDKQKAAKDIGVSLPKF